jgi:hypothetical protein
MEMRRGVVACVALVGCGRIDFDSAGWWDTAFTKRAQLTITNNAADPLAVGFPVELTYDLATLDSPTATTDSLRVVRFDPSSRKWIEVPRYTYSRLWFDLQTSIDPSATTAEYWLYFGNPTPSSASTTGAKIFDFFDGFANTAIDDTRWAILGAPTEGNNTLTLNNGDSVHSLATFGPGTALFVQVQTPSDPEQWWGFQRTNDFVDDLPWMLWIQRKTTDTSYPAGVPPGDVCPEVVLSSNVAITAGTTGAQPLDGKNHFYTVQRLRDRVVFKHDEQVVYEDALSVTYEAPLQIRITNYGTAPMVLGTLHVAQAVWPDPTVVIGTTEVE